MVGRVDESRLTVHANLYAVVDWLPSSAEHQNRGGLVCLADQVDNCFAGPRRIDVFDVNLAAQLRKKAKQTFDGNCIAAIKGTFRALSETGAEHQ